MMHEEDDEDDFSYTSPSGCRISPSCSRKPQEHDDTTRSIKVTQNILQVKQHQNILRQLQQCLGQVIYGDYKMVSVIANYWEDVFPDQARNRKSYVRNVKCNLQVKSEGVLINKALCLDKCYAYHNPRYYMRLTSSYGQASIETNDSIKSIGSGQFGRVFQAIDLQSNQFFAEKVISTEKFCRNELEIMSKVDHEHIVKFYGVIRTKDGIHIFMQYAAGGNIDELLRGGNSFVSGKSYDRYLYAEYWAMNYYKQVLSAVVYLRSHHIVHCDIKTTNVVLSSDKRNCFLTDFGEACEIPSGQTFITKGLVGTRNYMSPEVITDSKFHYESDVWCAGGFLLHMLTGKLPWTLLYPSLSTYAYVIGRNPNELKDEIPNWATSLTCSILASTFQVLSKRKPSSELLILAKRNLGILSNTEMQRCESPVSYHESLEEPTSLVSESDQPTPIDATSSHAVCLERDITNENESPGGLESSDPEITAELSKTLLRIQSEESYIHAESNIHDSENGIDVHTELVKLIAKHSINEYDDDDSRDLPGCSYSAESAVFEATLCNHEEDVQRTSYEFVGTELDTDGSSSIMFCQQRLEQNLVYCNGIGESDEEDET